MGLRTGSCTPAFMRITGTPSIPDSIQILGHRGRKGDSLYGILRLLTAAYERINTRGETRLLGIFEAGGPHGEVRLAWHETETAEGVYEIESPTSMSNTQPASPKTSKTNHAPTRSTNSDRPSSRWSSKSPTGTNTR